MSIGLLLYFTAGVLCVQAQDKDAERDFRRARKAIGKTDYQRGRSLYNSGLEKAPNHFEGNLELGILLLRDMHRPAPALPHLEKAEANMPSDSVGELYYYLGIAYHKTGQYEAAMKNYNVAVQFAEPGSDGDSFRNDLLQRMDRCRFAQEMQAGVPRGKVFNVGGGINTKNAEYVPLVNADQSTMLFTARKAERDDAAIDPKDLRYFEDMYISRAANDSFASAELFEDKDPLVGNLENTKRHESVVFLSADEDTLIVFKENVLWISFLKNDAWSTPKKMGKGVNIGDYQRHASITQDGKTIYFSSNASGGRGQLDLWQATAQSDGTWGNPTNLGPTINTSGDEDSPVITPDGKKLYFASTGRDGFGGYDLYMTELNNGTWSSPINLGYPLNSPADDLYLRMDTTGKNGYFASSRIGGFGDMDIYRYQLDGVPTFRDCNTFVPQPITIRLDGSEAIDDKGIPLVYRWTFPDGREAEGVILEHTFERPGKYDVNLNVYDPQTGVTFYNESLMLVDLSDRTNIEYIGPDTVAADQAVELDGSISLVKDSRIDYYFWQIDREEREGPKVDYRFTETGTYQILYEVEATDTTSGEARNYCIRKDMVVLDKDDYLAWEEDRKDDSDPNGGSNDGGDPNGNTGGNGSGGDDNPDGLRLEPVYFDFDKHNLRPDAIATMERNLETLKSYPSVKLRIEGHTDSKGSDAYNIKLSERRAEAVLSYLKRNGVNAERVTASDSKGEAFPARPNENPDGSDNPQGRAKNRRTELILIQSL